MLEQEKIKEIISSSIRSAVCIDDEYSEPYQEIPEGFICNTQAPKILYRSFRENGNCDLDIYNFKGYDEFVSAKEYLFSNKELLILDWELTPSAQIKYNDSLKILKEAVENDFIQFVTVYTQESDIENIALKIHAYFSSNESAEEKQKRYDAWAESIDKYLMSQKLDIDIDSLEAILKNELSGYILHPSRQKNIESTIINKIRPLIKNKWKEFCTEINTLTGMSVNQLFTWYESYMKNGVVFRKSNEKFDILQIEIGVPTFLVNNTLVFILQKQSISSEEVYQKVCNVISNIPNSKSLILALKLKEVLYRKLAVIGKGLGGIDEAALTYHANNYEEETGEGKFEYLVSCLSAHVTQHITENIKFQELESLFAENPKAPAKEKLAEFNSFLTFSKKDSSKKHQIKPGDIFRLEKKIFKGCGSNPTDIFIEYIICVSQSCDCLRPIEKLSSNFSFTGGKTISLMTAVSETETGHFSFINKDNAIQWNLKLFTIHIEEHIFDVNTQLAVIINGEQNSIEYIGNQKELFTQRLINATFNQALRMGIDLPHYKK